MVGWDGGRIILTGEMVYMTTLVSHYKISGQNFKISRPGNNHNSNTNVSKINSSQEMMVIGNGISIMKRCNYKCHVAASHSDGNAGSLHCHYQLNPIAH